MGPRISSLFSRRAVCMAPAWLLFIAAALLFSGCGPRTAVSEMDSSQKWKLVRFPAPPYPVDKELRILVWREYLPTDIILHFQNTYGVKVRVEYYSENEEIPGRLKAPGADYDLVMPGMYMVEQLIREKQLRPLNREHLPNFRNVDRALFSMRHDFGLKYSVPFYISTAGIAFNVKYSSGLPLTWPEFSDETNHPLARARIVTQDEMRTTLGTALLMLGCSPNSRNPAEIARARDLLLSVKSEMGLKLDVDHVFKLLADEDVIVGIAWAGDAARALSINPYVRFIVPRGPSITEIDSFCIPITAKHPDTAELFINFLLTPEISAALTNFSFYANTCSPSRAFISPEIINGPSYMEPLHDSAVFLEDVGEAAQYYRDAWKVVKETPNPEIQKVPLPFPRTQTTATSDRMPNTP